MSRGHSWAALGGHALLAAVARHAVADVVRDGVRSQCSDDSSQVVCSELFELAGRKLRAGANLTRPEAAAYLGVSTKRLQRMEISGALSRCPGLGTSVLYSSRDVLLLASASRRKGA